MDENILDFIDNLSLDLNSKKKVSSSSTSPNSPTELPSLVMHTTHATTLALIVGLLHSSLGKFPF